MKTWRRKASLALGIVLFIIILLLASSCRSAQVKEKQYVKRVLRKRPDDINKLSQKEHTYYTLSLWGGYVFTIVMIWLIGPDDD
jgi:hypothetical protein